MTVSAPVGEQYEGSLHLLAKAFLCMLSNGTPHYATLGQRERNVFEELLAKNELFGATEALKVEASVEAQAYGLHLSTGLLSDLVALRVRLGEALPKDVQARIGSHVDELHATRAKLAAARILATGTANAKPIEPPRELMRRPFTMNEQALIRRLWRAGAILEADLCPEVWVAPEENTIKAALFKLRKKLAEVEVEGQCFSISRRATGNGHALELVAHPVKVPKRTPKGA